MAKESISQQSASARPNGEEDALRSDDTIERIETYCLDLPYRNAVQFRSVREDSGAYIILRLVTRSGAEGIAESVARPSHSGEDPKLLAYAIRTFFAPLLEGADPFAHNDIHAAIAKVKGARTAHALIDVALWDLRGKLLGQPVWRLLGGGKPARVPVGWIAHGNTAEAMTKQAVEAIEVRGFSALKIKTWKRSREDVSMIGDIRAAVGDKVVMWADSNGAYTETEARTILPDLAQHGIAFLEEPCTFRDPLRMAAMAADLPIALLGDQTCDTVGAVYHLIKINAVGAVSVKLRRTGITDSLKIIALADAAGCRWSSAPTRSPESGPWPAFTCGPPSPACHPGRRKPISSRSWVTIRSSAISISATAASCPRTPPGSAPPSTGRRSRSTVPRKSDYSPSPRMASFDFAPLRSGRTEGVYDGCTVGSGLCSRRAGEMALQPFVLSVAKRSRRTPRASPTLPPRDPCRRGRPEDRSRDCGSCPARCTLPRSGSRPPWY